MNEDKIHERIITASRVIILGIILGFLIPKPVLYSQVEVDDSANLITYKFFHEFNPFLLEKPMEIELEFDIKEFSKKKFDDKYQPAELRVLLDDSTVSTADIRLKARGNFRRSYCHFPPIKLNFMNMENEGENKRDAERLKLVTHCKNSKTYEQYLLKEYLCYKMYNILSQNSFKVRLLVIKYIDSQGKYDPFVKYGFMIEETSRLAERLESYPIDMERISDRLMEYETYHIMALFQFLIGNTDWNVPGLQNLKLLKSKDPNNPYPVTVPYDFDYSGMVNATYAIPADILGIETVRERLYRGYCIEGDEYQKFFQQYLERKDELFALVNDFELLNDKHKREMINYLEEFYEIIESPFQAKKKIIESCLN